MKFEYYSEAIAPDKLNERLNALGAEGWEVMSILIEGSFVKYVTRVDTSEPGVKWQGKLGTVDAYRVFCRKYSGMEAEDAQHLDEWARIIGDRMRTAMRGEA